MDSKPLNTVLNSLLEQRDKCAEIKTNPKSFFVHIRVPEDLSTKLTDIQKKVITDPGKRAVIDHCTLVFTNKAKEEHPPERVSEAIEALRDIGQRTEPIDAKVQGWAYFDGAARDGKPNTALVALLDAPMLQHLHVDIARALKDYDIEPSDAHGFVPHITLGYLGYQGRVPQALPPVDGKFTIDKIHVASKDIHEVPLEGRTLGQKAASAAMVKEAIGQRQQSRMEAAIGRMDASTSAHASPNWEAALNRFNPSVPTEASEEPFIQQFSPVWHESEKSPVADIEKTLTSGRHHKSDIVNMPFSDDPAQAAAHPGVHPGSVAWRGAHPLQNTPTEGLPLRKKDPRWFSGLPSVSGGYTEQGQHLNAYALNDVPSEYQGPWTHHVAKDPRGMTGPLPTHATGSPVGSSPIYEKVIDAHAIPETPLSSYKPLPTPGRFQRVRGPNLLTGELPASVTPHRPTVKALEHSAPGFLRSLRAKKGSEEALMIKEAIGQRQKNRIEDAYNKSKHSPTSDKGRDFNAWNAAWNLGENKRNPNPGSQGYIDSYFSPNWKAPYKGPGNIPSVKDNFKLRQPPIKDIERTLTSGRHQKSDVVTLPFSDSPEEAAKHPGVHVDSVAWRGAKPSANAPKKGLPEGSLDPRWFSGLPTVSGGYAKPDTYLNAYELNKIPTENQGPWTRHLAEDPRKPGAQKLPYTAGSPVSESPVYEKVVDAHAIPETPLSSYKPLPTPGRYQKVRGPNLLTGELPASVLPHAPTVEALRKSAPAFANTQLGRESTFFNRMLGRVGSKK